MAFVQINRVSLRLRTGSAQYDSRSISAHLTRRGIRSYQQRGAGERIVSLGIQGLLSIVLQDLIDDFLYRVLRQIIQHTGIRNGITQFSDSTSALGNSKVSGGQRRSFRQGSALNSHIVIDVPSKQLTLV